MADISTGPGARPVAPDSQSDLSRKFYNAAWRWHFYAGLFAVPFLLTLAVTGLIMVYFNSIETRFGEKHTVAPNGEPASVIQQVTAANNLYPTGTVSQYIHPPAADRPAMVTVTVDEVAMVVAVDPYTTELLGTVEKDSTWYYFANDIHGTLLIGDTGDRLMEIAAGLAIILICTGLYLWWPRNGRSFAGMLVPRLSSGGRTTWKELHATAGFYISIVLLFFLLSGLAWTGIWGGKYVQAWSTFPAEKWDNVPLSDETHAAMNHGALEEVPWGLEQTPMPASGSDAGAAGVPEGRAVNLNAIVDLGKAIGFDGQFRVDLPGDAAGVYTISADSMSGDTTDPTGDRTVHVDQYTGKILAEVAFADYSPAAKTMAVSIALHQAEMGLWNTLLNTVFCLTVIFLCVSGIVMWWMRRPQGTARLVAPPLPANLPLWKGAVLIMLLLSLAFPLVGVTLLVVLAIDVVLLQSVPALRRIVN